MSRRLVASGWLRRAPKATDAELKDLGRHARRLFAEMDEAADQADAAKAAANEETD